jgi:hypothetical protein
MDYDKILALIDSAINNALSKDCYGCNNYDPCKFHKTILIEARIKIVEQGKLLNDR